MLALSVATTACGPKNGPAETTKERRVDADAAHLIAVLVNPDTDYPTRVACERALCQLPARDVLPRIAEQPLASMPRREGGPIFNGGGSAEADRGGPWAWQVFYALRRIRDHHMHTASSQQLRSALAGSADPDLVEIEVFFARSGGAEPLPTFEPAALRVVRDARRAETERLHAAQALLELDRAKHYATVVDLALGLADPTAALDLLARVPEGVAPDARILRAAFSRLQALAAANPNTPPPAYFLAVRLEDLVGAKFRPDISARYQGPSGLEGAYFADTVKAALEWWRAHQHGAP